MLATEDGGVRWQETENPATRYGHLGIEIRGIEAWKTLVERVRADEAFGALDDFLGSTASLRIR